MPTSLEVGPCLLLRENLSIGYEGKKGKPYKAKLVQPAKINYNPLNGRMQGDVIYQITYGSKTARVPGKFMTDSQPGPMGILKGQRAKGILGIDETIVKVVGALKFAPAGESEPLMLVSTEEYKLLPKK